MTIAQSSSVDTQLEDLTEDECRRLLGMAVVGRIAFVVEGWPVVFPVNYRFQNDEFEQRILLRTRRGHAIDGAPEHVAFEIDGIDHGHQHGWSVLVRGVLHHLDHKQVGLLSNRFDPKPWPQHERTSWLVIEPQIITGRRLQAAEREWALPSEAYL